MFSFNFFFAGLIFSILKDWVYFVGKLHVKPCSLVRRKCKGKFKEGKLTQAHLGTVKTFSKTAD